MDSKMIKQRHSVLFLLLLVITFSSCNNSTEPTNLDKNEISTDPQAIEINVNPDSLQMDHFQKYLIDYSTLKLNGVSLTEVKYYYPAPIYDIEVDREFAVAANDSFEVEIKHCKSEYEWLIDLGTIEFGDNTKWINSEVALLRTEKSTHVDSAIDYRFIFKTLKGGKGYICFIERNYLGEISSKESHGLIVGYSINPLKMILLHIDEIQWKYNTQEGTFSTVSVRIKGTTNIYRLRGLTYGDGLLMAMDIPIQNDNSFEIEMPIAFSHMEGVTLKTNSELLLYGTIGLPKIIPLINPKGDK